MTKKDIFATIKEVNEIADEMTAYEVGSKEYDHLSEMIGWYLDGIVNGTRHWYNRPAIHLSRRTGHYWVTFP